MRGEGDNRVPDGWMASPTQWMWVWVNSMSWWWTGRPGVLQSMCSQSVRHYLAAEMNWTCDSVGKNPPAMQDTENIGLNYDSETFLGKGHNNPLQYSYLENLMDRVAWRSTVRWVTKSWTRLKWLCTHACMHHYSIMQNSFNAWNIPSISFPSISTPEFLAT